MITSIRGCVVCNGLWSWPTSSRSFSHDFVYFTACVFLDGFFPDLAQMIISMRGCVTRNDFWHWPISLRSFSHDLTTIKLLKYGTSCYVCSTAHTALDEFFPYLAQMISSMRGCVACNDLWPWPILSRLFSCNSNFISRRIQYNTFHTHNISTISQMYSSGGCQRSSVAHRADNRYFNNDTAVGKQGARGNIFFSQMCRAYHIRNMSGSIQVSLIVAYSLMIRHGAHKYKIITIAKHTCTRDIIKFE